MSQTIDQSRQRQLNADKTLLESNDATPFPKKMFGHMTDYAAWGIGGAFLMCLLCGLYMGLYYPNYRLASQSDWPPFLSSWSWDIIRRIPEPDPLLWLAWSFGVGFGGGLFAGPKFGRDLPSLK